MSSPDSSASESILQSPLSPQPIVWRMKTFEALSQPFRYELSLLSDEKLERSALLNQPMCLSLTQKKGTVRHFHGYVVEFHHTHGLVHAIAPRDIFTVVLRPWLWLLGLRKTCRIFRELSAIQIAEKIFAEHGFGHLVEPALTKTHEPYEYCVQYNESDLDFVNRLLEREGIYYHFEHSRKEHKLVLLDQTEPQTPEPLASDLLNYSWVGAEKPDLQFWNETNHVRTRAYTLDDYDYLQPTADLETRLETEEPHAYPLGTQLEYPGGYSTLAVGNDYVQYRLHAQNAPTAFVTGGARQLHLRAGSTFTTDGSPTEYRVSKCEAELVFLKLELSLPRLPRVQPLDTLPVELSTTFNALASKTAFRPECRTVRPVIAGVQTALVVGSSGDAKPGAIDTDEYGRIWLKFPWAREQDDLQQRSCPVRVAQSWAGNAWGTQFIPRVGQEVVVAFLEGDPDRPLVVGSVYNAQLLPPFAPAISGLKTDRAIQGDGPAAEPNVLAFDDDKGRIGMSGQKINLGAKDAVGISAGLTKIDLAALTQAISLFSPYALTLQTATGKIEFSATGIEITGPLIVNGSPYPLPPSPATLVAAGTTLALEAAKLTVADAATGDMLPTTGERRT